MFILVRIGSTGPAGPKTTEEWRLKLPGVPSNHRGIRENVRNALWEIARDFGMVTDSGSDGLVVRLERYTEQEAGT